MKQVHRALVLEKGNRYRFSNGHDDPLIKGARCTFVRSKRHSDGLILGAGSVLMGDCSQAERYPVDLKGILKAVECSFRVSAEVDRKPA